MTTQEYKPSAVEILSNLFVRFLARPFFSVPYELDPPELAIWYLRQITDPPTKLRHVSAMASLELDLDLLLLHRCTVREIRKLRCALVSRRVESYYIWRTAKSLWLDNLAIDLFRAMLLQADDVSSSEILFEVEHDEPGNWTFSTKQLDQWKPHAVFPAEFWDAHVGLLLLSEDLGLSELWEFREFLSTSSGLTPDELDKFRTDRRRLPRKATIVENDGRRLRIELELTG